MQIGHAFVGVVTEKLAETRKFYTRFLGFRIVCDMDWYLHLADPNGRIEIGFLAPNHPTQPHVFQQRFQSPGGVWICLEVPDAEAEYRRLSAARAPMAVPLADEPWGERHFVLLDPSGVPLNIAQRIPADPSFVSEAFAAMPEPAAEAFVDEIDEAVEEELELEAVAGDDVASNALIDMPADATAGEPEITGGEFNVDSPDEEYVLEPREELSEPHVELVEEPAAPSPPPPEPPRPEPPLPWSPFAPGEPLPAGVYIQEPTWRRPPEPVFEPSEPAGDAAFELIGDAAEDEPSTTSEPEPIQQAEAPVEAQADADMVPQAPSESPPTFEPTGVLETEALEEEATDLEPAELGAADVLEAADELEVADELEAVVEDPVFDDGGYLAETPSSEATSDDAYSEPTPSSEPMTTWEPPVEADLVEASESENIPPYAAADDEPEMELELEPVAEQPEAEATALGPDFDFVESDLAESDLQESESRLEGVADESEGDSESPVEEFEGAEAESTVEMRDEYGGLAEAPDAPQGESFDAYSVAEESPVQDEPSAEVAPLLEETSPVQEKSLVMDEPLTSRREPAGDEEVMLDDYGSVVHFHRHDEPADLDSTDGDSDAEWDGVEPVSDADPNLTEISEVDDSEEWKLRLPEEGVDDEDDLPLI